MKHLSDDILLVEGLNELNVQLIPKRIIKSVTVYARCRCSDPDRPDPVSSYLAGILCNGSWAQGGDHITQYYKLSSLWRDLGYTWTTNPATGQPWTQEEINRLQIGVWLWASAWTPAQYADSWCTQVWAMVEQEEAPYLYFLRPYEGPDWEKVADVVPDEEASFIFYTTSGLGLPWSGGYFNYKVR